MATYLETVYDVLVVTEETVKDEEHLEITAAQCAWKEDFHKLVKSAAMLHPNWTEITIRRIPVNK